jgi:hypothetical protein
MAGAIHGARPGADSWRVWHDLSVSRHMLLLRLANQRFRGGVCDGEREELSAGDCVTTSKGQRWRVSGTERTRGHSGSAVYVCTLVDERVREGI